MLSLRMFLVFSDSVIVEQILKRTYYKYYRRDNSSNEKINYFLKLIPISTFQAGEK